MLDKIDQQLQQWARQVVGEIEVSLEAPGSETAAHKIGVYLFEIRQTERRVGGHSEIPLRVELRYLITSWSQQPKEAHRALAQLLFNALESREYEVDIEPLPVSFWNAFKCPPRPCFVLQVPIYHELPQPQVPAVKIPPEVQTSASTALFGRVLGPNRIPLAGASVEVPSLGLRTASSADGDFRFAQVPADPLPAEIIVTAKGNEYRHQLQSIVAVDKPIIIEIPLTAFQPAS